MYEVRTKTIVIPAGSSVSNSINLEGYMIGAFDMPAEWTTANITLLASSSRDGTYKPVYHSGIEVTETVTAGQICAIENVMAFAPLRYIKVRSGNTTTPVVQAAERTITLILKDG